MKTNLFIAALSLVVLAGCSSEDEIDTLVSKSDNAITFGTYVGKQTKAIEKSAFAENDQFGVFAFYTKAEGYNNTKDTPNFMYEQSIKKGARQKLKDNKETTIRQEEIVNRLKQIKEELLAMKDAFDAFAPKV